MGQKWSWPEAWPNASSAPGENREMPGRLSASASVLTLFKLPRLLNRRICYSQRHALQGHDAGSSPRVAPSRLGSGSLCSVRVCMVPCIRLTRICACMLHHVWLAASSVGSGQSCEKAPRASPDANATHGLRLRARLM